MRLGSRSAVVAALGVSICTAATSRAQQAGAIEGTVTLEITGEPVHGASVLVVESRAFTTTDAEGRYRIGGLAAGRYTVLARREHLSAERRTAEVAKGYSTRLDFELGLSPIHEEITVTASAGGATTALDAFNVVESLDSFSLTQNMSGSLGEVLEEEPGIRKRGFGPGNARPIIRGFDGDRVLIMQDGIRTGDLSSQSGDHGVTLDPANHERIEVLKGPITLLYGSNAVGGVVNAITPQDSIRDSDAEGFRGQLTADAGSANQQLGLNGTARVRSGPWAAWFGGGARRTDDYDTPEGKIVNSETELFNGRGGFGYFGESAYASLGFQIEDGRFGVPFADEFHDEEGHGPGEGEVPDAFEENGFFVDLDQRRQSARLDLGLRDLSTSVLGSADLVLNWIGWQHEELETDRGVESIGTVFNNDEVIARLELEQGRSGRLSGKFGASARFRDYDVAGEEALAPPTRQNAFAAFLYEELDYGRTRIQFGGRIEHNDYEPKTRARGGRESAGREAPEVRPRSFTGASGSVGVHLDLPASSAFVANLTASSRPPALDELYNFGPHVGNLAFEIGNPDLGKETTLGVDLSLRHHSSRGEAKLNTYYYDIDEFVFAALTGQIAVGLQEAEFLQGDARFLGVDFKGSIRLGDHLWVRGGLGYTNAKLTGTNEDVPRIPPLHGSFALEIPYQRFSLRPELVWAAQQDRVFRSETATDGYAVLNVTASYVLPRSHAAHIFAVRGYNLTNELYRNHTSFIKDLTAEIGRGVKFTYTLRFF